LEADAFWKGGGIGDRCFLERGRNWRQMLFGKGAELETDPPPTPLRVSRFRVLGCRVGGRNWRVRVLGFRV
jgi:hypothetical protein